MSLVFLILGGNRGNTEELFSSAIDLVTRQIGPINAISALYESESWGFKSDVFLNQIITVKTQLIPIDVLKQIQNMETLLGRIRNSSGYEARTIDIDILYYDDLIIESADLTIPHPRISQRRFVLVPLVEIAPDLKDPLTGITMTEMLEKCEDKLLVKSVRAE